MDVQEELSLESMEELPPRLSDEPLQTPVAPSFDLLDLPPPTNTNPPTDSATEMQPPAESPPAESPPADSPPAESPPVKPADGVTGEGEGPREDRPPPPRPQGDPTVT